MRLSDAGKLDPSHLNSGFRRAGMLRIALLAMRQFGGVQAWLPIDQKDVVIIREPVWPVQSVGM